MTIIYARNYLSSFLFKCLPLTRNDFEWYLLPLPNSKTVLRWAWWVDLPKYSLWIMIIDSCEVFNEFFNWLKVVNFCGIFLQKFFFLVFWREKTICNICKIKTLKIFMLQSSISTWGVCEWVQYYKNTHSLNYSINETPLSNYLCKRVSKYHIMPRKVIEEKLFIKKV